MSTPPRYQVGDEPIPRHRLTAPLPADRYGDRWRAHNTVIDRPEVIRLIAAPGPLRETDQQTIYRILNARHEFLLPVYETEPVPGDGRLAVIVAHYDRTLADHLAELNPPGTPDDRRRGLPAAEAVRAVAGAAAGLDWLHQTTNCTHGRVRPDALVWVGNRVLLADAGLTMLHRSHDTDFGYTAPEQLRDAPRPRADQYALAISYYELRTGRRPIPPGLSPQEAAGYHLDGRLDFTGVSDAERAVLRRATAVNPDDRFPTCAAFAQAVKAAAGTVSESGPPSERYYLRTAGRVTGPFTRDRIVELYRLGRVSGFHEASADQITWTPVSALVSRPGTAPAAPAAPAPAAPSAAAPPPTRARADDSAEALQLPADEDVDADELPARGGAFGSKRTRAAASVGRRATVRYYSRMNPQHTFPLLVVLAPGEIEKVVKRHVEQAVSAGFAADPTAPVEVEPILPGCGVYPPKDCVEVAGDEPRTLTFYVVPQVFGTVLGARIAVRQNGRLLTEIPLAIKVRRTTAAWVLAGLGLLAPYATTAAKSANLDFESQKAAGFPIVQTALQLGADLLRPEWLGVGLLGLALVVYLWLRPRRREVFWDVKPAG